MLSTRVFGSPRRSCSSMSPWKTAATAWQPTSLNTNKQFATVTVAIGRIASTARADSSYLSGGVNVALMHPYASLIPAGHCVEAKWRYPQNCKHIAYHNFARGEPSHDHVWNTHKKLITFRDMHAERQTDRQTDRQTQSCPWVHFMWPDPTQPIRWPT